MQAQEPSAPTAPGAPTAPDLVQELERLWHLPFNPIDPDRTEEDRTGTNGVRSQFDPLEPEITPQLIEAVLQNFDVYKSQELSNWCGILGDRGLTPGTGRRSGSFGGSCGSGGDRYLGNRGEKTRMISSRLER